MMTIRQLYQVAMMRSGERGFNGWNTYGVWFAAWTGALFTGATLVMKVWGPADGALEVRLKKHRCSVTGDVHEFRPAPRSPQEGELG